MTDQAATGDKVSKTVSDTEDSTTPGDLAIVVQAGQDGQDALLKPDSKEGIVLGMADEFRNQPLWCGKPITFSYGDDDLSGIFESMQKWADFEMDLETNPRQPLGEALEKLYVLAPELRPKTETERQEIQPTDESKARL